MPASRLCRVLTTSALVVLLVIIALLAAACGGTEETTTTGSTSSSTAPSTTEAVATTTTAGPASEEYVFGMLLVGPYNDHGWSQANYEGGTYVETKLPGARMIYVDKVNSADRPGTTPEQLAEDLVSQGAKMVLFTSDDMKDGAITFANAHPDIPVVHTSGDGAWKDGKASVDLPNLSNIMGQMEYGKMIAGVAAALTTQTGKIGYLGPLINDETRRLAASVYLGAKYAWTEMLKKDPAQLKFSVNWIGFWFNIPGVTSDPTQVADNFFNQGFDVVVSGIDTTEALVEAGKLSAAGKKVWAIPYDFVGALDEAPSAALGVPYFNWGPQYLAAVTAAREDQWTSFWNWVAPDWADINNPDTSIVGFKKGEGLSTDAAAKVDEFVKALAAGLNLWRGPVNLQDGSPYLKDGETATELQIWYLPQLLEGMEGQSVSE
ncbi:MAG: BMP family ABC transporter substrate-binding protein [Acidobacteria bacterium RBG_16_64_8]|nr:MAG: BMP family ABC transporter substrate-binding protein [Acidobacteria bacterium RBG_16_64_8]